MDVLCLRRVVVCRRLEPCVDLLIAMAMANSLQLLVMPEATSAAEWVLGVAGAGTRLSITTIKCTHWTLVLARLAPFQVGYKVQSDYLRESPEMMPKMQG